MREQKRSRNTIEIMLALLILGWAGAVAAQEHRGPRPERDFMDHDENGDGVVSEDEFPGPGEHFVRLDANDNGVIDESEAPKGPPPPRPREGEDAEHAQEGPPPPRGGDDGMNRPDGPPPPRDGEDGREPPEGLRPGFLERFDEDGDGVVAEDEFKGPAEHFEHLDRDGDGYISKDEGPKGPPPGGPRGR